MFIFTLSYYTVLLFVIWAAVSAVAAFLTLGTHVLLFCSVFSDIVMFCVSKINWWFWGTTTSGFLAATVVYSRTTVSVWYESFHAVVKVCNSYVYVTKPTEMWLNTAMGPFMNHEWQLLLSENLFRNTDMQTTNCLNESFRALAMISGQWMTHYTVSQKTRHYTFRHNLGKCWQIFKIFSDLDSALNLQYVLYYIFRHTLNLSCETEKDKNNSILMYSAK